MSKEKDRSRLYNHKWRRQRELFLYTNPLCVMCEQMGRVEAATVVDHIEPHKGSEGLFWDVSNWQSLCKHHHDSAKQEQEHRGVVRGGDSSGEPFDPRHHWNGG